MLLFDLTLELAQRLGVLQTSFADAGGTTAKLVDATILSKDDTYKNGAIWVLWDAGDAGAAPENEFARITGWTLSTNTFDHDALTAATGAGSEHLAHGDPQHATGS